MALWGGRFTQEADQKFKFFNDSLRFDYRLALQDIDGSIGWAKAITSVGVLTEEEHQQLVVALKELRAEIEPKIEIILKDDAEDIHSWVESKLIEKVGDLGKKLHTGRSRNDQVAVDMKMWCKAQVIVMQERIRNLQEKLVLTAEANQHAVMPGYTHLQRAQPITFAHWCMAYFEMLERDYSRLTDAYKRMYTCPLGSGALAGTAYAVDRDALAKDLGFSIGTRNSLDSVSDRDHVLELLSSASISMVHLSRFAEDLIFFNSGESAFLELSDRVTSGSSLMPQKKNPDACELIRGKSGRVFGSLTGLLTTLKGLPLAAQQGYSNATELADYLVAKGIPFREAHHIVGEAVVYAISKREPLEALSVAEFKQFHAVIDEDVYPILSLESCLEKRCAKGGVNPECVAEAIRTAKESLGG